MGWSRALDDFAALLDQVERRLDADEWGEPAAVATAPAADLGPPGAADRARAEALLARLALTEQRVRGELHGTAGALSDLARRRTAAARYGTESRRGP